MAMTARVAGISAIWARGQELEVDVGPEEAANHLDGIAHPQLLDVSRRTGGAAVAVRARTLGHRGVHQGCAAQTPADRRHSRWRAIRGDTTSVTPGIIAPVIWLIADLPEPVGRTASTSRPATTAAAASS